MHQNAIERCMQLGKSNITLLRDTEEYLAGNKSQNTTESNVNYPNQRLEQNSVGVTTRLFKLCKRFV